MRRASLRVVMPAGQLALEAARRFPEWVVALALDGEAADEVVDRVMHLLAAEQIRPFCLRAAGVCAPMKRAFAALAHYVIALRA